MRNTKITDHEQSAVDGTVRRTERTDMHFRRCSITERLYIYGERGFASPTKDQRWKKAWRAIEDIMGETNIERAIALSNELLARLADSLDVRIPREARVLTMTGLAQALGLRPVELLMLSYSDFTELPDGDLDVRFTWQKADPRGNDRATYRAGHSLAGC